ncbi:fibronectin type III domain-containing protein [Actinoplanes sp. NPDC049265]|uniref:fibronectin type III domain-containing protein n=1 Tax=Actinoplanes sp. NPDC049265 TaxID=3363902 RepID=UPI00371F4A70
MSARRTRRRFFAAVAVLILLSLTCVVGLPGSAAAAGGYALSVYGGTGSAGAPVAGPVGASPIAHPAAMTRDASGTVWAFVTTGCRVVKVTTAGTLSVVAGNGTCGAGVAGSALASPLSSTVKSLAVDSGGNLFIGDNGAAKIFKVTPGGTLSVFAGNGTTVAPVNGAATSSAVQADSMAVDGSDNLYVGYISRSYILKITAAGALTRWGGTGTPGNTGTGLISLAPVNQPVSLAVDSFGNVYIGDAGNRRVYKVVLGTLIVSPFAGNGTLNPPVPGSATSPVPSPNAMAVDSTDTLFVYEGLSHEVLSFSGLGGTPTLVAGNGSTGTPNPGLATGSPLGNSTALVAPAAGTLLLGDADNNYLLRLAPQTVPGAPTGLAATPGPGSATLTFSPPANDGGSAVTGYEVTTNGLTWSSLATTGGGTKTGTVTGLINGVTYTVQVRAVNAIGNGAAGGSTTVTPATTPGAPTGVVATAGNTVINLAFQGPVSDGGSALTGYDSSIDNGTSWQPLTVTGTLLAQTATLSGLTNATAYTVILRARNAIGTGPASAGVSATPRGSPNAPAGLTATPGNGMLSLSFTTPGDGGYPILAYQVSTDDGGNWAVLPVTTSGTTNTATVTGLANGSAYQLRVRAVNLAGAGASSAAVPVALDALVPDTPTGLTAVAGSTTVALNFQPPASTGGSPITGYEVSTDNGTSWGPITVTDALLAKAATVTGLVNGTTYTIRLRAVNAVGAGPAGAGVTATPVGTPYPPTGLTATAGNGQAALTFTTPGTGGYPILSYQASTDNGSTWLPLTVATAGTTNSATVTGLSNGTSYQIRVRAVNLAGGGAASTAVTVTPPVLPPDAPGGPILVAGNESLSVTFTPPAASGPSAVTGYEVSADDGATWSPFTTTAGLGTRSGTVAGLTNGTSYAVRVRALNTAGPGPASTAASAIPRGAPYAPAGLAATPGDRQATVTFTTPADGGYPLFGYQVSTDDGATWAGLTVTTSGTVNTGTVTGLSNGVTYAIRVRAVNLGGAGAPSAGTAVSLAALPPDAPTGLIATPGNTTVDLAFQPPANTGGGPITGYQVSTDDGATWAAIDTTAALLARTATVTGLTNGVTYAVRLRAVTAAGAGAAGAAASATPRGAPYAPGGLNAVRGNGQAVLTFTTPADGGYAITGYQVSTDDGATWATLPGNRVVTGLTNGVAYPIRVRATNLAGAGQPSAAVTVTPATVPGAPTSVAAAAGNTEATVAYNPPASDGGAAVTGYQVSADDGMTWAPMPANRVVTGLTNGTAYRIRVRAVNAIGAGSASAAATVTPVADTPDAPTGLTATRGDRSAVLSFTPPVNQGVGPVTGYQVSVDDGVHWATLAADRTVTGLSNGVAYTVRVRALNSAGAGPAGPSVTVTPATTPTAPSGLSVAAGDGQAVLSFTAPADNGGDPITSYQASTDDGASWAALPADRTVTGLTNGTTYDFRVRAVNGAGPGAASSSVPATPARVPGAPTGLTATPGDNQAVLAFTAPGDDGGAPVTGYQVSVDDGATWAALPADRTVTGLTNGTTYTVRVRALNRVGAGPAGDNTSVTPDDGLPDAPTDLHVVRGDASVTVTFTPGGGGPTGYQVSTDGGTTWAPLAADGVVTGLTNGTGYTVAVRAVNAAGAGPATPGVTVTPATVPDGPSGLVATAGDGRATLSWTPPGDDGGDPITGYQVSTDDGATWAALPANRAVTGLSNGTTYAVRIRAVNGVGPGAATASVPVTPATTADAPTGLGVTRGDRSATLTFTAPADTGGRPVTGYQVSTDDGASWATLPADRVVTGLTNGVTYTVRVRAVTAAGPGAAGDSALVTPATTPDAPGNLAASAGDARAVLMFTDPADGGDQITGYQVSLNDGATWASLAADRTVTGLANGTTYTMRVRAVNGIGPGPASGNATATPMDGLPGAPTGLTATRGNAAVTLDFTAPAGPVTGYDVSTDGGATWTALAADRIVTGLANGTAYTFRVRARNATGPGPASGPATETPATVPGAPGGLTATAGDRSANLAFSGPGDDGGDPISGYEVSLDDGAGWTALPGNRTVTGLTNGRAYTVRVRAVNSVGAGPASGSATVTPAPGTPGAPTGLTATRGDASVTLAFTPPAGPVTGYEVTTDDGATWAPLAAGGTVTSLANGTAYTFRVRARNNAGPGPASAQATAVPAGAASAPAGLGATPADSAAHLTFTRPADDGGTPIAGYEVSVDDGTSWAPLTVAGTSSLTATVTGLDNGTSYPIRVRATTDVGPGAPSDAAPVTPVTTPGPPTGLNASAGDARATLIFTAPATDGGTPVTGYQVSLDDGATWAPLAADRVIPGLTNGTTYTVRVRAVNAAGPGPASESVSATPVSGLPGAPTGLTATGGDASATLSFTPPPGPVSGFEVSTDDGWNWAPLAADRHVLGLTNGTTYTVRVRALNATGAGPASGSATVTPAAVPGRPAGLRAVSGDGSAALSFTAPDAGGSPITGYDVSLDDGATWASLAADRVVTGLANGTTYAVRVRAVNGVGAGPASARATVTPAAVPGAPTDLAAVAGDRSATLSFTAPDAGGSPITGYDVSLDDGATWAVLPADRVVTGLTNGATYRVRVRARTDAGTGPPSSPATVTPLAVPGAPTGLTVTPGDTRLTLAFTAPAATGGSPITGYQVSTDDGGSWASLAADRVVTGLINGTTYAVRVRAVNQVGAGPASLAGAGTPRTVPGAPANLVVTPGNAALGLDFTAPGADGGAAITGYQVSLDNGATWAGLPAGRVVTGLVNGTTYAVRVRAVNAAGAGAASASATGTPVDGLPGPPTGLRVSRGNGSVTVSFDPGGGPVTGYQVSTDDGVTWAALAADRTVSGLTNGVTYRVRVRAVNDTGASPATAAVAVTPATTPGAPTAVTAARGDRGATVTFTPPAGDGGDPITGYEVSTDGGASWSALDGDGRVTGLTNGTAYAIKVRARNDVGAGPASVPVAVTPAGPPAAPTGLAAAPGNGSATLTFTAPDANGSPITGYQVSTDDGVTWAALPANRIVTGLTNGTTYAIRVRAVNAIGAGASSRVTVTPAGGQPDRPGVPGDVTVTRGNASIVVAHSAASGPVTGYQVSTDDGATWAALPADGRVTGLTNGVTYAVRVRALSADGPGPASAARPVTPATVPDAPTAVRAAAGDASAGITFTAPASTGGSAVTRYDVSLDDGATWAPLPADGVVTGLTNGSTYAVRVRAVNDVGAGPASTSATVTPVLGRPGAPSGLTVARGDGSLTVTFTPAGGDPTGYQVSVDGGATWTALRADGVVAGLTNGTTYVVAVRAVNASGPGPATPGVTVTPATVPAAPTGIVVVYRGTAATVTFTAPASTGGAAITGYQVSLDDGATWRPLPVTGTDRLTGTVTGLTAGADYTVRVRAVNDAGAGPGSDDYAVGRTPAAPTGVRVARDGSTATVTFTPPEDETVTGYEVSFDDGATWATLDGSGLVTDLSDTATYVVRVRAVNDFGAGTPSEAVVSALTPAPATGLVATGGVASIVVGWTAPADSPVPVTSYRVVADPGPATCTADAATTSCLLGATAGVTYTIHVVTVAGDRSTTSAESVTATAAAPTVPGTPPAATPTLTTDRGPITRAEPGDRFVVEGDGYAAFSSVTIVVYSTPRILARTVADIDGHIAQAVTLPTDLAAGRHTLIATGVDPRGAVLAQSLAFTVAAAAPTPAPTSPSPSASTGSPATTPAPGPAAGGGGDGWMPKTGQNVALVALAGLLLIAAGGTLLLIRRR